MLGSISRNRTLGARVALVLVLILSVSDVEWFASCHVTDVDFPQRDGQDNKNLGQNGEILTAPSETNHASNGSSKSKQNRHRYPDPGSPTYKNLVADFAEAERYIEGVRSAKYKANISIEKFLLFYRYRQQAKLGDCTLPKPSKIRFEEFLKWSSWTKGTGLPPGEAMAKYVLLTSFVSPFWYKARNYVPLTKYAKYKADDPAPAVEVEKQNDTSDKQTPSMVDKFMKAALFVRNTPRNASIGITDDMSLKFYKYYKQAMEGDCHGKAPSVLRFTEYAKYNAWAEVRGMSVSDAQEEYVKLLASAVPDWEARAEATT